MAYETVNGSVRVECFSQSRVPPMWRWAWDGLVAAVPGWESGGAVVDLVAYLSGTWSGTTPAYTMSAQTSELKFAGAEYITFGNQTQFATPLNGAVTVAAIHTPTGTGQAAIWTYAGADSTRAPFALIWSLASGSQYAFWNDNNADGPTTGATTFALGGRNFVIGRRDKDHASSPTLDLFVNGGKWTTTSTTLVGNWDNAGTSGWIQTINRFGGYAGYMGTGTIANVLVWNRALTDVEIDQLLGDPWGPLRQMSSSYVFFQAPAAPTGGQPTVKRFGGVPFMSRNIGVW